MTFKDPTNGSLGSCVSPCLCIRISNRVLGTFPLDIDIRAIAVAVPSGPIALVVTKLESNLFSSEYSMSAGQSSGKTWSKSVSVIDVS